MAHILIAEDERDIRDLIQFTLTYAGHEVTTAANGEEAVQLAQDVMPDLVMLDRRMPKMDGLEACRTLKSINAVKDIPVVFLSAKGMDEDHEDGQEPEVVGFITKPFAPDDLSRRVGEILEQIGVV